MPDDKSWIERTLGIDLKTLLLIFGIGGVTGGAGGLGLGSADAKLYDECDETRTRQSEQIVEMRQLINDFDPRRGVYYRSAPGEAMEAEPFE